MFLEELDNHQLVGNKTVVLALSSPSNAILGSVATRFPQTTLAWDAAALKFTNELKANDFVRRP